MAGCTGKRRGAVVINTDATAQEIGGEEKQNIDAEPEPRTISNVNPAPRKSHIVDLYSVDEKSKEQ